MKRHTFSVIAFVLVANLSLNALADWPEFRGPFGNGHVTEPDKASEVELPLTWSETENVRWKTPIPHRGWSTPVVMNGQVWLTTATEDGHDFYAICVDADTGDVLHNKKLFHSDNPEPLGNPVNCYATPSPAIEPGRVYVHFGSYGTACLDSETGEVIWKRDDLPCRHYRGPSSSVVLFENLVILTFDGIDLQYVAALNKDNGKTVWRTDRDVEWKDQNVAGKSAREAELLLAGDRRKAHSTPLVVSASDGRAQMLSGGAKAAFAYDPRTGSELWRFEFDDFSVAPRPIFHDDIAYMVTGITHPELWAIRIVGASGNIGESDHIQWRLTQRVARTASPVLVDGLIYMVSDDGIINCIDAATGDGLWQKRIGGAFAASPIYGDGRIYFCDQDGQTTIIKPGREFESLATNTLDDGCLASPAAADGALFLRSKTHLYRIEGRSAEDN